MNNSDRSLFPSCWTILARAQIDSLRAIDAAYEALSPYAVSVAATDASATMEHMTARRTGQDRFTRSHDRMSAFILRDLTSNADDMVGR